MPVQWYLQENFLGILLHTKPFKGSPLHASALSRIVEKRTERVSRWNDVHQPLDSHGAGAAPPTKDENSLRHGSHATGQRWNDGLLGRPYPFARRESRDSVIRAGEMGYGRLAQTYLPGRRDANELKEHSGESHTACLHLETDASVESNSLRQTKVEDRRC